MFHKPFFIFFFPSSEDKLCSSLAVPWNHMQNITAGCDFFSFLSWHCHPKTCCKNCLQRSVLSTWSLILQEVESCKVLSSVNPTKWLRSEQPSPVHRQTLSLWCCRNNFSLNSSSTYYDRREILLQQTSLYIIDISPVFSSPKLERGKEILKLAFSWLIFMLPNITPKLWLFSGKGRVGRREYFFMDQLLSKKWRASFT